MALQIRSILDRFKQIIADVKNATGQTIPAIDESWDNTWALVQAGMSKTVELAIARGARNILPSSTLDETVLAEYARWGDAPRGDAVATVLNVTGTGVTGETIGGGPSGVQFVSETGIKFYFEEDFLVPSDAFNTQVTAYIKSGEANLTSGVLSITAENPNIGSTLTIRTADPIARRGQDVELFESWRGEVNQSLQQPKLADNYAYFYRTTRNTPGGEILAGYAYNGRPGQLLVYVESTATNGVPTAEQLTAVREWYDGTTDGVVRIPPHYEGFLPDDPAVARFQILACVSTRFRVRVTGMLPNTEVNQDLVGTDVQNYFSTRKPFIRGVSIVNTGLIDDKALTSVVQSRVESGDIQAFTAVEYALYGVGSFVPRGVYPLGQGELARVETADIEWPS